jgi:hypothetical protein
MTKEQFDAKLAKTITANGDKKRHVASALKMYACDVMGPSYAAAIFAVANADCIDDLPETTIDTAVRALRPIVDSDSDLFAEGVKKQAAELLELITA